MTSDEMKAAIERAKRHECCSLAEYDTVMALAEIGRLAVERQRCINDDSVSSDGYIGATFVMETAADAFLAGRGGEHGTV